MCAHTLTNTDAHSDDPSCTHVHTLTHTHSHSCSWTHSRALPQTHMCVPRSGQSRVFIRAFGDSTCRKGFPTLLSRARMCAHIDASSTWMRWDCSAFRVTSLDKDPQCQCDQSGVLRYRKRATGEATVASLQSRWHPRSSVRQEAMVSSRPETQDPSPKVSTARCSRALWTGLVGPCCVPGITRAHWTKGLLFEGFSRAIQGLRISSELIKYFFPILVFI